MSAIDSNSSGVSTLTGASASRDAYSAMSSGDFLKIMFTELTKQDPLQPSQTKDLLQQIGTIRSIESNLSLTDDLGKVVKQNEVVSASSFVGQTISGLNQNGVKKTDVVKSVSVSTEGTTLNLLGGDRVKMKNVQEILGFVFDSQSSSNGSIAGTVPTPAPTNP